MKTEPLHTATDSENGISAKVYATSSGYSVVVRDDDADDVYATYLYPTLERAVAKADTLVV
jgi:hypothetical protein